MLRGFRGIKTSLRTGIYSTVLLTSSIFAVRGFAANEKLMNNKISTLTSRYYTAKTGVAGANVSQGLQGISSPAPPPPLQKADLQKWKQFPH
jgi:hypothetical protein